MSSIAVIPVVMADALIIIALFLIFPALSERFNDPTGSNALLLSLNFLLVCIAVFWLRRLIPQANGDEEWLSRGWRAGLAVFFALTMSLAIAWQLGFFESGLVVDTRDLGEGGSAAYFVFAPGAWLGFAMIYVLVMAFNVTPRIETTNPGRAIGAFLSLLVINSMILLLAAQARVLFQGWSFLWLPILFTWFLGLFAPPRLLYAAREAGKGSPPTYLLLATLGIVLLIAIIRILNV